MDIEKAIAERLTEVAGDMTQGQLAKEIGISQSQLSRLLNGKTTLTLRAARRICKRFPSLSADIQAFLLANDMRGDGRTAA